MPVSELRSIRGLQNALLLFLLLAPQLLLAQTSLHIPQSGQLQLQVAQPMVDVTTPVTASASFDPPVVRPGEKTFYRANVDATESAIIWPDEIPEPGGLQTISTARGMITQMQFNSFRPHTTFLYEFQPTAPGRFTITNFTVMEDGTRVEIPAATLEVDQAPPAPAAPRRLALEISETNVYLGQPFRVRVMLPASQGNQIEAIREIQFNGEGLMTDKTTLRNSAEPVNINGELKEAFVCEMAVTPIAAGPLKFSAQGFTAGSEFTPGLVMHGQLSIAGGMPRYTMLVSDPVEIKVRPLPVDSQLPGFTGAIGKFFRDQPQLSTNRLHVGEPVELKVVFHGEGDLSRLAPPVAPTSRDWQIIADPPPATGFTLIPLTDDTHETPAIPFSYFDPEIGKYVDLTIPSLPVTVVGEGLPVELAAYDDQGNTNGPLRLSTLATVPGKSVGSLKPLQLRGWFLGLQLLPAIGFIALWQWDRRRRYLEAHPEIVRRAQARRALRREKLQLEKAVTAGDTAAYVHHAARAMNIAAAPHYPANPQALVGGDVLAQLDEPERNGQAGEIVKKVFAAADAQFAGAPQTTPDLPALRSGVDAVLNRLEERLNA